jgi:hypothetical protein
LAWWGRARSTSGIRTRYGASVPIHGGERPVRRPGNEYPIAERAAASAQTAAGQFAQPRNAVANAFINGFPGHGSASSRQFRAGPSADWRPCRGRAGARHVIHPEYGLTRPGALFHGWHASQRVACAVIATVIATVFVGGTASIGHHAIDGDTRFGPLYGR